MMPIGTCRLCLKTKELQDSHFMPAAAYKQVTSADYGKAAIIITPEDQIQISDQVTGHLLCQGCEQRLKIAAARTGP